MLIAFWDDDYWCKFDAIDSTLTWKDSSFTICTLPAGLSDDEILEAIHCMRHPEDMGLNCAEYEGSYTMYEEEDDL